MKENLNSELEYLRGDIEDAKKEASTIISLTSSQMELYADKVARQRIDEKLKESYIKALISEYVTNDAKQEIERKIQKSYNRTGEIIPVLVISYQKAYNSQNRPAMDRINSFWKDTENDAERKLINDLLKDLRVLHYQSRQDLNKDKIKSYCTNLFEKIGVTGGKEEKIDYCKKKIIENKEGYSLTEWKCLEFLTNGVIMPFEYYKLIDY